MSRAGLLLDVLIGLDGGAMMSLRAAGQPIPAPLRVHALIDTGTDATSMSPVLVRQLGLAPGISAYTQTAGGLIAVELFDISLSIPDPMGVVAGFVATQVLAMQLSVALPDCDVLLGLDLITLWRLTIDGPARSFSLEY